MPEADGYLSWDDVDGIFGDVTHAATVRWQQDRGLTADGSVGWRSWANPAYRLGVYQFWDAGYGGRGWRTASYNTRECR